VEGDRLGRRGGDRLMQSGELLLGIGRERAQWIARDQAVEIIHRFALVGVGVGLEQALGLRVGLQLSRAGVQVGGVDVGVGQLAGQNVALAVKRIPLQGFLQAALGGTVIGIITLMGAVEVELADAIFALGQHFLGAAQHLQGLRTQRAVGIIQKEGAQLRLGAVGLGGVAVGLLQLI